MTGTSIDGIDAAVIEVRPDQALQLIATHSHSLPEQLAKDLAALCVPGPNEIDRMGSADRRLGTVLAAAVQHLLVVADLTPSQIIAIGSHGQTIRHRPDAPDPFTLQIGDPNVIAELTGITTVADLRRRDMAAGGQGAPLAPGFHRTVFDAAAEDLVIVNIGGIANVSILTADGAVRGFDTGPGNTLMDAWVNRHHQTPYDAGGQWAASADPDAELLEALLLDPYFAAQPPKSTGREQFNLAWLAAQTPRPLSSYRPASVQATLMALTASTISNEIVAAVPQARTVAICGGGRLNSALMAQLRQRLPDSRVAKTEALGWDGDFLEAGLCAWLAARRVSEQHGNEPAVTGAAGRRVLGGVYPGFGA